MTLPEDVALHERLRMTALVESLVEALCRSTEVGLYDLIAEPIQRAYDTVKKTSPEAIPEKKCEDCGVTMDYLEYQVLQGECHDCMSKSAAMYEAEQR